MEFLILGPLEARDGGRVVPLGGRKQRAVLAYLLLNANEVVSKERLIDQLWGERPPETVETMVQVYVSRLRKALASAGGDAVIVTRAPGYVLRLGPGHLDRERFERLADEGRHAAANGDTPAASAKLGEALALWRGPALADLAYEPFAPVEIATLEEARLACLEDRIDADLALGRHGELVGELDALVAAHPLRERFRAQLMLALYRGGRQAEALEAYQATRRTLVDELGIEPGRTLQELERAILNQDPSLEQIPVRGARASTGRPARTARSPFVGRERELAVLTAALEEALAGSGRLVLLAGEPGIGKSRLAEELTNDARGRGARVVIGRCWEAGGAPAYWPWVQALRTYMRDTDPASLRAQLADGASDVAQILPELRDLFPDVPVPPSLDPEGARFRLFDSMATFLRNAAAARPLVVALDDLHAADEPTLLLLQFVTRELGDRAVLVVGAYRDVDPTVSDPLSAAVTNLAREPVTRTVALAGLGEHDIARFIEVASGEPPREALVEAIHEETEGNPLFVGEIVRLLLAEGRLDDPTGSRFGIPQTVKEVIGRRLRHLSAECNHILTLASVLGREFDLDALAHVGSIEHATVIGLLDEAISARVASEVPGVPGRLRFGHALIRDTAYESLTSIRRVQLHGQVGAALEELYADNPDPHLAELAHHFSEAAPAAGPAKAVEYARRAGDRALALLAYEEAARLYEMALGLTADRGAVRCDLLLALGEAQARSGDTPAGKATFREAAELAASGDLPEQLARAALGYGGRLIWNVSRDDPHLVPLLDKALAALGDEDSILRVRLLGRLAGGPLRDWKADAERRLSLGVQALDMARRIRDPSTLAYALQCYMASRHSPEFTPEQIEVATELVQVALEARDLERAVEGYELHLCASVELGDLPAARADLEAMTGLADELRQPAQRWLVTVHRGLSALLEGRFEEAEQLISATRSLGERAMGWNAEVTYGLQLYALRREQGRVQEVEELVRRAATDNPTYPIWRCVRTSMLAELGATDEAATELAALAAGGFGSLPFDEEWDVSTCLLAEAAARLGATGAAATLYESLLPYADRVAISYPEISVGPIARFLGLLATTAARWEDAEGHFRQSLELSARMGARPSLAHTQRDYARMLLERADSSDLGTARTLLDHALATYRALGMDAHFSTAAPLRERATLAR